MKYVFSGMLTVLVLIAITGCISLSMVGPPIESPHASESSMLIVDVSGKTSAIENTGYSGWIPWVEDSTGHLVPFAMFDKDNRLDTFYYAENLTSGIYSVKGFIHVYADTAKLKKFFSPIIKNIILCFFDNS